MKSAFLSFIFVFLAFSNGYAQTKKPFLDAKQSATENSAVQNGISEEKWDALAAAIKREDWAEASLTAEDYLKKTGAETKDKQIARLRYIYLYSLAGQIIDFSVAGKEVGEENARRELERAANQFIGEEFILPSRKIRADCTDLLNYVCASKDNPGIMRITATNSTGTSIHSFDYVKMSGVKLDVVRHSNKDVVLGGILEKVEFNPNKSNIWIMRLIFKDGYVKEIHGKD